MWNSTTAVTVEGGRDVQKETDDLSLSSSSFLPHSLPPSTTSTGAAAVTTATPSSSSSVATAVGPKVPFSIAPSSWGLEAGGQRRGESPERIDILKSSFADLGIIDSLVGNPGTNNVGTHGNRTELRSSGSSPPRTTTNDRPLLGLSPHHAQGLNNRGASTHVAQHLCHSLPAAVPGPLVSINREVDALRANHGRPTWRNILPERGMEGRHDTEEEGSDGHGRDDAFQASPPD